MEPLLSQMIECQSATNTQTDNLRSNLQQILELMQKQQQEIESLKALNNSLQLKLELLDTKVTTHSGQILVLETTIPTNSTEVLTPPNSPHESNHKLTPKLKQAQSASQIPALLEMPVAPWIIEKLRLHSPPSHNANTAYSHPNPPIHRPNKQWPHPTYCYNYPSRRFTHPKSNQHTHKSDKQLASKKPIGPHKTQPLNHRYKTP